MENALIDLHPSIKRTETYTTSGGNIDYRTYFASNLSAKPRKIEAADDKLIKFYH